MPVTGEASRLSTITSVSRLRSGRGGRPQPNCSTILVLPADSGESAGASGCGEHVSSQQNRRIKLGVHAAHSGYCRAAAQRSKLRLPGAGASMNRGRRVVLAGAAGGGGALPHQVKGMAYSSRPSACRLRSASCQPKTWRVTTSNLGVMTLQPEM